MPLLVERSATRKDDGIVDDVILPEETRHRLVGALRVMSPSS